MTEILPAEKEPEKLPEMGLMDHLTELRKRLINSIAVVILLSFFVYGFSQPIFDWLQAPFTSTFTNDKLIGTGPAEALILKITVSFFAAIVIAIPYLFYQMWLFIAPGLYSHERRMVLPFVFISTICFLVGVLFCYHVVLPYSFGFFRDEYASIGLAPQIKMTEHLSFTMKALVGFGIVFEMPILAFFLGRVGILTDKMLLGAGRYAIVIIFVVAGVLTPPDVISQLLMVAPMLLLYGVSILVVRFTQR